MLTFFGKAFAKAFDNAFNYAGRSVTQIGVGFERSGTLSRKMGLRVQLKDCCDRCDRCDRRDRVFLMFILFTHS